ncbi:hypothetical protein A2U01_0022500, partial [Trifolium medium]|nr:hypothetical protein [Trifolium medium]
SLRSSLFIELQDLVGPTKRIVRRIVRGRGVSFGLEVWAEGYLFSEGALALGLQQGFSSVYLILDEFILAGELQETSKKAYCPIS